MRKSCLVKLSGDCIELGPEVLTFLRTLSENFFVVILVGGGTQINREFEKRGWPQKAHGPLGREHETFEQKQVARDILEQNQAFVQDQLAREKIPAQVIIPVLDIASVLCHVNGDEFVKTAYLGFNKIIIQTVPDRLEKKRLEFAWLPKIEIIAI